MRGFNKQRGSRRGGRQGAEGRFNSTGRRAGCVRGLKRRDGSCWQEGKGFGYGFQALSDEQKRQLLQSELDKLNRAE